MTRTARPAIDAIVKEDVEIAIYSEAYGTPVAHRPGVARLQRVFGAAEKKWPAPEVWTGHYHYGISTGIESDIFSFSAVPA